VGEFTGAYGDQRRAAAMDRLFEALVEQQSVVIRKLGGDRGGELAAHRVLACPRVTPEETLACLARRTGAAVSGRRVVAAHDTTEVNFTGRLSRGLGPGGNGSAPGFFIHAMVAVDADEDAVLGLVDARIWTRTEPLSAGRRQRALADKESRRWLDGARAAGERLRSASEIIVVGDRESDIHALFSRRPPKTHLLVRAAQNRALDDGTLLFAASHAWPTMGERIVRAAPRGPGDRGRDARLSLRAGTVTVRHPRNGRDEGDPDSLDIHLVEAIERDPPAGVTPLHWRLLTTLPIGSETEVAEIVRLYRLRWRIEQTFRMLKTHGLDIEAAQTADPRRLFNLAALATGGAVRIIQLVDARDGGPRPATDVASTAQIAAATALCPTLEGKTERQRNHHPPGSLAWLSWVVARLGGWNCYYKPPGPKTMRDGWNRFAAIAEGFELARIPP
jgi:hypothetical protein